MTIELSSTFVAAERLGWPPETRGWRRWLPWETQDRLIYEDQPRAPTATCHLQTGEEVAALCGYPWECLTPVPGNVNWTDLHPSMRCDMCSEAVGVPEEDPAGREYRFRWPGL